MIGKVLSSTMKLLTVILSFCGGEPPISIREQSGVLQRVRNSMQYCTNNKIDIDPVIWPKYVDVCSKFNPVQCDTYFVTSQVLSQISVDGARYIMYILPKELPCNFAGLGVLGPCRYQPCSTWINGYYASSTSVYLHELGHNLGLGHAKYKGQPYGDMTDLMGACCADRCFNAVHLDLLQVQNPKQIITYPFDDTFVQRVVLGINEYITIIGQKKYYIQNRQSRGYEQLPEYFKDGLYVYINHPMKAETSELIMMIGNSSDEIQIDNGVNLQLLNVSQGDYTVVIYK
jgi:hypothetical protein